jgi:hypothetical protein
VRIRLTTEQLSDVIVNSAVNGAAKQVMSMIVNYSPKFSYSFQLYVFQNYLTETDKTISKFSRFFQLYVSQIYLLAMGRNPEFGYSFQLYGFEMHFTVPDK